MREKGSALIILLLLFVTFIVGGVYLFSNKKTVKKPTASSAVPQTSANFNLKPSSKPNPSPTSRPIVSPIAISENQFRYLDKECNLDITYPRKTIDGNKEYLWTLDAISKRTAVLYEGRKDKDPINTDHSITIYAQPPGSKSIFYDASADIVCTKNEDNLSLESFKEKFLLAEKENQPTVLEAAKIGGFKFIPITLNIKTETGNRPSYPIYIGVYNDFLYEVMNSNPGSGKLQEDAKSIINNIKFIDPNSN